MATRIFRFKTQLNAGQSNDGASGDPQIFTITAPSGVNRTIVELRPFGDGPFEYKGSYDTELYHDIDSDDINTFHRPHFVGLLINGTHSYNVIMTNLGTSTGNFGVDVVVEETAQGGTATSGTATA